MRTVRATSIFSHYFLPQNLQPLHLPFYDLKTEQLQPTNMYIYSIMNVSFFLRLEMTFSEYHAGEDDEGGGNASEDSIDSVVSYIIDLITEGQFQFELNNLDNLSCTITAMHEETFYSNDELWEWCR